MKRILTIFAVIGTCLFLAASARADWEPYKMHWPQAPDPKGWDVNFVWPNVLADDWLCTQTGAVSDIHFWFSSRFDRTPEIDGIHVSIHKDIPADESPTGYSEPGEVLWERDFWGRDAEFVIRRWRDEGSEGWYDPETGEWARNDHTKIWQANIQRIPDPFIQQEGTIYWLDLSVMAPLDPDVGPRLGWKTTFPTKTQWGGGWNDDATWNDLIPPMEPDWNELIDPVNGVSLDLAFVITPEPSTVTMLVGVGLLGLLAYVRLRRRRGSTC